MLGPAWAGGGGGPHGDCGANSTRQGALHGGRHGCKGWRCARGGRCLCVHLCWDLANFWRLLDSIDILTHRQGMAHETTTTPALGCCCLCLLTRTSRLTACGSLFCVRSTVPAVVLRVQQCVDGGPLHHSPSPHPNGGLVPNVGATTLLRAMAGDPGSSTCVERAAALCTVVVDLSSAAWVLGYL